MTGTILYVRLLGNFSASIESLQDRSVQVSANRSRALLAYLLLRPELAESRERLAALLWDKVSDAQARQSLRQALFALRKDLAVAGFEGLLIAERDRVSLDPARVRSDVWEFESCARSETIETLERVAVVYKGDLLEGLSIDVEPFECWIDGERQRWRSLAATALAALARRQSAIGNGTRAIAACERLVALDPLEDGAHRLLIQTVAAHEGPAAALIQADLLQRKLATDFDSEPDAAFRDLVDRLRIEAARLPERAAPLPSHGGGATVGPVPTLAPSPTIAGAEQSRPRNMLAAGGEALSASAGLLRRASRRPRAILTSVLAVVAVGLSLLSRESQEAPTGSGMPAGNAVASPATTSPSAAGSRAASAGARAGVRKEIDGTALSSVVVVPFTAEAGPGGGSGEMAMGISERLIEALTLVPSFRVISSSTSRNLSTGRTDALAVARELGVDYAVEGRLAQSASRIQIDFGLVDSRSGLRVWAQRYETGLSELPSLREDTARSLARQLHVAVMDIRGVRRASDDDDKVTETLHKAWDALNRYAFFRGGEEGEALFQEVLRADATNASALTGLGAFKSNAAFRSQGAERRAFLDEAERLLSSALDINPQSSLAHHFAGQVKIQKSDPEEALASFKKAVLINPSHAPAYGQIGLLLFAKGQHAEALEMVHYAIRLSPADRYLGLWSGYIGRINFELGNMVEAERWLRDSVRLTPRRPQHHAALAAFYAETGRTAEAQRSVEEAKKIDPSINLGALERFYSGLAKREEAKPKRMLDGLAKAFGTAKSK